MESKLYISGHQGEEAQSSPPRELEHLANDLNNGLREAAQILNDLICTQEELQKKEQVLTAEIERLKFLVSELDRLEVGAELGLDRTYREEPPEEALDGGYHLYANEKHRDLVGKNPDRRIVYAIQQFEAHGIEYALKNEQTGHFHCWRKSDGKLFQFYAGTGKIQGCDRAHGIHALIRLLKKEGKP